MKRGLRNGVAPYIPASFCRDARSAGHGATRAARPFRSLQAGGFASGMEARQGGDSSAGSVHDSPPRQGDARKRHKQENNKTDSNQSSRKKKNSSSSSSRNNNIISNKQMTGLKRQKPHQNVRVMKGAARKRGPFQRHRRAVFSRRGQTGIYPPACPESSGTQTNNHRRNTGISKRAARQLLADVRKR
ncbi:hypothetical protein JNE110611_p2-18 (plasmid) [Escherichia coli]|nr:hypothetical protein JNE110611_p2-18 [Escherichia coli]